MKLVLWACAFSACGNSSPSAETAEPSVAQAGSAARAAAAGTSSKPAGAGAAAPPTAAGAGARASSARAGAPAAGSGAAGVAGAAAKGGENDADAGPAPGQPAAGSSGAAGSGKGSTGPGDWVAGDYPPDLMLDNYLEITGLPNQPGARQYKVHVPPGYDPKIPAPVLFCLHGLGQDALLFCVSGANMPAKSDAAGFVLVMPNGYSNSWNAGTCCGDAADMKLDDVGFVRAVFAEVSKHVNVDLSRVYATGLSNGGYLSYRLACEASDLFAAVAPGAGAIGSTDIGGGTSSMSDITKCSASNISVLDIHGTEDPLIPFSTQKPSLERIAMQDGCMLSTQPASQPTSQGDATCFSYEGCPAGVDVTGCSVMGGGHVWFGSPNCGTGVDAACAIVGQNSSDIVNSDVIWEFFKNHPRP